MNRHDWNYLRTKNITFDFLILIIAVNIGLFAYGNYRIEKRIDRIEQTLNIKEGEQK